MKRTLAVCLLAVGFLGANTQQAFAQFAIYMQVSGVDGASTNPGHEKWIELRGLRQIFDPAKLKKGCDVEVLKDLDIAGPRLWWMAVTGHHADEVRIEVVTTGSLPVTIYELVLEQVAIQAITTDGTNTFVERVTLLAGDVTLTYRAQKPDGSVGASVTNSWRCQ